MRERGHIRCLDGIRGIAVILVLAVHFQNMAVLPRAWTIFRWLGDVMAWGWCGVDLFFVLSGFLITGILLDKRKDANRFRSFYSRRIRRIFPLYYAVVLFCIGISIFLRHSQTGLSLGPSPNGWITYLLYIQNWWIPFGNLHQMGFLGPFWSLAIEEQFYLIWPVCVWRFSTTTLIKICGFGMLVAFLLRWYFTPHATSAFLNVIYMNTLTRMDALLAGGVCAISVRNPELLERVQKSMPVIVVATASALLILVIGGERWNSYDVLVYGHLLLALGFGCLVLWAYLGDGNGEPLDRFLRARVLTVFGKYSYAIYVYQGVVLVLTLLFFRHRAWWGHSTRYAFAVAIGWITVPFVVALLSYHLFEKKLLRPKDSFAGRSTKTLFDAGAEVALKTG